MLLQHDLETTFANLFDSGSLSDLDHSPDTIWHSKQDPKLGLMTPADMGNTNEDEKENSNLQGRSMQHCM